MQQQVAASGRRRDELLARAVNAGVPDNAILDALGHEPAPRRSDETDRRSQSIALEQIRRLCQAGKPSSLSDVVRRVHSSQTDSALTKRDSMIRMAHELGAPVSGIAAAAGIDESAVWEIIKG